IGLHEYSLKDMSTWLEKQTYLALGIALMAAAELNIGAAPMEGFHSHVLDAELGLRERGFTSIVLLALGNRPTGGYHPRPKSRLSAEAVFTFLEEQKAQRRRPARHCAGRAPAE